MQRLTSAPYFGQGTGEDYLGVAMLSFRALFYLLAELARLGRYGLLSIWGSQAAEFGAPRLPSV